LILYDTTLKVSQEQIRKECDLIRRLQEANLKDPEIINQLQMIDVHSAATKRE
jgi:hypothetical protein